MSSLSSTFNATAGQTDNVQAVEGFTYSVASGSPTALTATPTIGAANAFQYNNCSPCPIKITLDLVATGANGKPDPTAAPVQYVKVLKPGESWALSFKNDVILGALIEEADVAPVDAITLDAAIAVVAAASTDLEGNGTFLNC